MIKAWSGAKARSSLHAKRSVITPLSESTHGKTAPCSLHFKSYQGLKFAVGMTDFHQLEKMGEKKHVAHCCCSAGTPKIIPATAAASH